MLSGSLNDVIHLESTSYVEDLYLQHRKWLQLWLRGKTGSHELAADLAQDTFLRVILSSAKLKPLQNPKSYLSSIARNLLIDHWRHQELVASYAYAVAALPEDMHPSAEEAHIIMEALQLVDKVLQAIAPETRRIFLLYQLEGFTYSEIAQQLGCAELTVKRHMRKALIACMQMELE